MRVVVWLSMMVSAVGAAEPTPREIAVEQAEAVLSEAGFETDEASLLRYLKSRTRTPAKTAQITKWIEKLGADDFETREQASRELVLVGEVALDLLEKARNDPDPERASRVRKCLEVIIEGTAEHITVALIELLGERAPEGTVQALLDYIPQADPTGKFDVLVSALERSAVRDGKVAPELLGALEDEHPLRRAIATVVVGRKGDKSHREKIVARSKDSDFLVRFHAASALIYTEDRAGVGVLIDLIQTAPMPLAYRAESLLVQLAREKSPSEVIIGDSKKERRRAKLAWEAWYDRNGDSLDLGILKREKPLLGIRLVCMLSGSTGKGRGNVFEYGRDNKRRWEIHVEGNPVDIQRLPNGHVLVAEFVGNRVTERDRKGKVVFERKLKAGAVAVQPLPNGNIFMASSTEILEVTRTGKTLYTFEVENIKIRHAKKLANNRVLYVGTNNHIVEVDPRTKKMYRTIPAGDTTRWGSIEPLPNGNYLVARCEPGEVVELTPLGKVVSKISIANPTWAMRLRNGHTLVACAASNQIAEYDRAGRQVWHEKHDGSPCRFRQY